jgi:hypothetical protein
MLKTTYLTIKYDVEVFIRISWSHWNRGIRFRGVIETAEAASTVTLRRRKPTISNDFLEFLGEFEAIFETDLALESGP